MEENTDFKIVAKTLYGLEHVLANELLNLGAKKINIGVRQMEKRNEKQQIGGGRVNAFSIIVQVEQHPRHRDDDDDG